MSPKRRPEVTARKKLIAQRQGDPCEVRWDEGCGYVGSTLHEPLLRSRGGNPASETGTTWVCFHCHMKIHHNPLEATLRGWMIHAWDVIS